MHTHSFVISDILLKVLSFIVIFAAGYIVDIVTFEAEMAQMNLRDIYVFKAF